jgi:hypothetical protein
MNITVPSYLTIKQLQRFNSIKHLEGMELYVNTIAAVTEIDDLEGLGKLPISEIKKYYLECANLITSMGNKFYAVVEFNGETLGFDNINKMSTATYIDLEMLSKDAYANLDKIMALLYRPVTKNKLNTFKFYLKTLIKYYTGKPNEDLFEYYEIGKYEGYKDKDFSNFPASIALGAMGFFLQVGNKQSLDSLISFHPHLPEVKQMVKIVKDRKKTKSSQSKNIMVGYLHLMNLLTVPSYQSQETRQ